MSLEMQPVESIESETTTTADNTTRMELDAFRKAFKGGDIHFQLSAVDASIAAALRSLRNAAYGQKSLAAITKKKLAPRKPTAHKKGPDASINRLYTIDQDVIDKLVGSSNKLSSLLASCLNRHRFPGGRRRPRAVLHRRIFHFLERVTINLSGARGRRFKVTWDRKKRRADPSPAPQIRVTQSHAS
jgi:hypothetical protein